ncbi:MAG: sulfatase-like hydrolase/transferase [Planctomycetota bacterium]|nr:sulfatase-like hydrolase/transferase [Planctomycetota bacterium]
MSAEAPAPAAREPVLAALGRAMLFAAVAGGAIGLVESAKVLATANARYVQWACRLIATGGLGYAAVGALLAIPSVIFALALWGRPSFRAAPASACAGLGAAVSVALFALVGWISLELAVPAALAATAIALALKELLAWWPLVTRVRVAWSLLGLGAAACIGVVAWRWSDGLVQWIAWALAGVNVLVAIAAWRGWRAPHAATAGALALLLLAAASAPDRRIPEVSTPGQLDVLVVSIDTLRADALGCYGKADAQTPTIDALAAQGVLFEDATSQANTTGPSHTTLLTGLYPAEHGARSNGVRISNRARTLADALARTHATGGFVSGFTLVDEASGLAERFDWYEDQMLAWRWMPRVSERLHLVGAAIRFAERRGHDVRRPDRPAGETVDRALDWIHTRGDEPLFTFVHFYDPHVPYAPPREFALLHGADMKVLDDPKARRGFDWYELSTAQREALVSNPDAVAHMKALYAGEISYADAQLKRLLDGLEAAGRLERTLIVLTSDHGEGLGSHDYWFDHGSFLFDEELHVPLIVRFPGNAHAGTRVKGQVRLLDVAPTVLDVLGLQATLETTGESLLQLAQNVPDERKRPSFAISDLAGNVSGFDIGGRRIALRASGSKLIWSSSHWLDTERIEEREQYFTLANDPDEQTDLRAGGKTPALPYAEMQHVLEQWRESTASANGAGELDRDLLEQLRKLGYL